MHTSLREVLAALHSRFDTDQLAERYSAAAKLVSDEERRRVRQVGDQPISKVVFWSIRTTVCPEAYNHFRIEPGHEAKWRVAYEFYELPK